MARSSAEVQQSIATLVRLLEQAANDDYIGEGVSQLAHALQAAAFAQAAAAPADEILAALLHDVGHLCAAPELPRMGGLGVLHHEDVGADFLASLGMRAGVTELVRGHVAAKRYLVSSDARYAERLSDASRATLRHQGGPMSDAERRAFEALPQHRALLRVRAWDERAKDRELRVPDLDHYVPLLREHLRGR